ncbi:YbfB/YjiJ family MFS transporter [Paenibacillus sp. CGMCC 1.16610]|uniref:YbfB/YjiJ family MFS transporter n=1 Tax=Paenibacillus anseongense TaxID=2682845 RepID=A0ABW9U3C4_9BACL|nr:MULTISPECIES: YbfB/YjiJ family MFS transporter [Paenibacillus]MBA2940833.1 YbfB/YjiJ family MFS transporter [Paenibacillus sp. CGMCC 1.16610]MVQ34016.1 YbfB/YjiJ family MFS transporter [Paenibacillus anseongense]
MKRNTVTVLIGGIAAMMVAMGIGRFAFTPILPMMMENHLFSPAGAGYLASSNYLGYLIGAFLLTLVQVNNRSRLLLAGLIASIVTTWGMGEFHSLEIWLLLRFLSGLASAVVFVIASSMIMDRLSQLQAGIFYGGVGAGILLTGVSVPLLAKTGDWIEVWKGLGLISLLLGLTAWYLLRDKHSGAKTAQSPRNEQSSGIRRILIWLTIAYGLEGLGYIVTGTYLVAYAKTVSNLPNIASLSWILVGIAGAPSCILWSKLASQWGKKWTLTFSMILQSVGIAIPVLIHSSTAVFVGAFLFGATFMGITMLTVSFAKDLYPQNNRKIIGLLTTFFGLGQIIGPLIAGHLISGNGSYLSALIGAALIVLLGAVSLPLGIGSADRKQLKLIR